MAVLDLLSVVVVVVVAVVDEVVDDGLLSVVEDVSLLSAEVAEPPLGLVSILPASADTRDPFFSELVLLLVDVEVELLLALLTTDVFDALSSKNLLATSLALEDTRNDLPLDVVVVVVVDGEDDDDDEEDLE